MKTDSERIFQLNTWDFKDIELSHSLRCHLPQRSQFSLSELVSPSTSFSVLYWYHKYACMTAALFFFFLVTVISPILVGRNFHSFIIFFFFKSHSFFCFNQKLFSIKFSSILLSVAFKLTYLLDEQRTPDFFLCLSICLSLVYFTIVPYNIEDIILLSPSGYYSIFLCYTDSLL